VTSWFANRRNRSGNTRSKKRKLEVEKNVLTACDTIMKQQAQVLQALNAGHSQPPTGQHAQLMPIADLADSIKQLNQLYGQLTAQVNGTSQHMPSTNSSLR
jgi:hypothetical protein